MKPVILLDAGHGGLDFSANYTTKPSLGKRKNWPGMNLHDQGWFYEGVGNRVLASLFAANAMNEGFPIVYVMDMVKDTPLYFRTLAANKIYANHKNSFLISFHSNAGGGKGWEIYTSVGKTKSDLLATEIYKATKNKLDRVYRTSWSDGDPDKEKNFYILQKTRCPAVLIEHGFFDNKVEVKDLVNMKTLNDFSAATWEGVKNYMNKMNIV